jgi:hypothetical protein
MAKVTPTLYDLSVPTFLQTVRAVGGWLDRTTKHCAEAGTTPEQVVTARLVPDMAPFYFQIEALKNHSVWGMEAAKTGVFAVPPLIGAVPFADLQTMISDAITALEGFTPDEVNNWSGRKLDIEIYQPLDEKNATTSSWRPQKLAFTTETFLLSYSLPNFYFHSVTAYNILRTRGVPLGKFHFQGELRTRVI